MTEATASAPDPEGVRRDLSRAVAEYERLADRVDAAGGESAVRRTAGAYRTFRRLLADNEESATGSGFQEYIQFQEKVADQTADLDESLPAYDAFQAADDAVRKKRLTASDFENAREALDPAREYADLLVEWEAAEDLLREARRDAGRRLDTLADEIAELDRLRELGEADLDAPVEQLRHPIEAYNDAVAADFATLKRDGSARDVLDVVVAADRYPLVEFRDPPTRLATYLREAPIGEESITMLLEYADYSAEKLSHYVENPGDLKRHVATNRTYLTNLDAAPLQVAYPPPDASTLRYECKEYASVCNRFAGEETLAALREVRSLPDATNYDRLRNAAAALTELGDEGRERLAAGDVDTEIERLRAERTALADRLETAPEA